MLRRSYAMAAEESNKGVVRVFHEAATGVGLAELTV